MRQAKPPHRKVWPYPSSSPVLSADVLSYTLGFEVQKAARSIFAHCAQNVSFVADNVNGRGGANRSATARRRGENAFRHHCLGDRFFCKRYRKSCNAYCDRPIACARPRRRGRFSGRIRRIFREFNAKGGVGFDFYKKRYKTKASCLRYFRPRECEVAFAAILGVNGC